MKKLIEVAIATGCMAFGCASTTPKVEENQVAHMTVQQRQIIVDAEKRVTVAEANVSTAKTSLEEAKQYRDISDKEVEAANTKLKAAEEAKSLGQQTRSRSAAAKADAAIEREQSEVAAASAKKDYADRLVSAREADLARVEAELEAEQQRVELTKTRIAFRDRDADRQALQKAEQNLKDAQSKVDQAAANAKNVSGEVDNLKDSWTQKRQALEQVAGQIAPAAAAPDAPKMIKQKRERKEPPSVVGEQNR